MSLIESSIFCGVINRSISIASSSRNRELAMEVCLVEEMNEMDDECLVDFERWFRAAMDSLCSWDMVRVAEVVCGSEITPDEFLDFRAWIVSMGAECYQQAVSAPSHLIDFCLKSTSEGGECFCEFLHTVITLAIMDRVGDDGLVPFKMWPELDSGRALN